MTTPQALRRSICRLLIGVLVSTQAAIAAYGCPGVSRMLMLEHDPSANAAVASDPGLAANPGDGMGAGCDRLDPALPNLCVAQSRYGQQSADHSPALTVPAVLLTSLYTLSPLGERAERIGLASGPEGPPAAAGPPHAVLHCCFRE
jgi:hypothetical protein